MMTMRLPLLLFPENTPHRHIDDEVKGKTKQLAKNVL